MMDTAAGATIPPQSPEIPGVQRAPAMAPLPPLPQ
jgi:hypothetical protein